MKVYSTESIKTVFLFMMVILLCLMTSATVYAIDITGGVAAVDPDSAQPGETVGITFTLDNSVTPAPPMGTPDSVWLGDIEGAVVSRSGTEVSATFTIPSDQSCGTVDAKVVFQMANELNYLKTDGFTIDLGVVSDIVYVDENSQATDPDGTSWATAFTSLQEALSKIECYEATQVWVADGTYTPTSGSDRTVSFELIGGVSLYGGFSGNESDVSERDYTVNVTILSGDIGTENDSSDNSYHVLIGADSATIDGFTISGGYAVGHPDADGDDTVRWHRLGGGMYNDNTSPTIANCIFSGNYADSGGAMYNYEASPAISDSTFSQNTANYGGAILFRKTTTSTIGNCRFEENSAEWRGGGIYIDYGANPVLSSCEFIANTTNGNGGAVYVDDRSSQLGGTYPEISSCSFTGNTATYRGGAVAIYNTSTELIVSDCTFSNNSVTDSTTTGTGGGAMACNAGGTLVLSNITYDGNSGGSGDADYDLTDYDGTESCTLTQMK